MRHLRMQPISVTYRAREHRIKYIQLFAHLQTLKGVRHQQFQSILNHLPCQRAPCQVNETSCAPQPSRKYSASSPCLRSSCPTSRDLQMSKSEQIVHFSSFSPSQSYCRRARETAHRSDPCVSRWCLLHSSTNLCLSGKVEC